MRMVVAQGCAYEGASERSPSGRCSRWEFSRPCVASRCLKVKPPMTLSPPIEPAPTSLSAPIEFAEMTDLLKSAEQKYLAPNPIRSGRRPSGAALR
jgi:hypothetical protein